VERRRGRARRSVPAVWFGTGGTVILLVALGLAGASGASPARIGGATAVPLAHGGCTGPTIPGSYAGSLSDQGGGLTPPSVANQTIQLSYEVTRNVTSGNVSSVTCLNATATATTAANGDFSVTATVPTSGCNGLVCTFYTGPSGPPRFAVPSGVPAGFYLTQSVTRATVGLAFVAALNAVALTPSSRVTLSADAPTVVRATATSGNGAPSPAALHFDWRLAGTGWSMLTSAHGANVTIEAADQATPGTLTVWVNGTFNGSAVSAAPATLEIAARSTSLSAGSLTPTALDAGAPATFALEGLGAGGYLYSATIFPGLGRATVVAPCTTSVVAGGLVALNCSASVVYPDPGTAQPSANLSNGFSSATWDFAPLVIAPGLAMAIAPSPALAYVDQPFQLTVTPTPSTGTVPYGPACLWPGDGRILCATGPGPSYAFPLTLGNTGTYDGHVTLADAGGSNRSAPCTEEVFSLPTLAAITTPSSTVAAGTSLTFASSLSGGAFPVAYWWNATGPATTLYQGVLSQDGGIVLDYRALDPGLKYINLTVRDALGSEKAASLALLVLAGPAAQLVPAVAGEGVPIVAGTATPVTITATDPVGEPVASFEGNVSLAVLPAEGGAAPTVWLNTSQGALAPSPAGRFDFPGSTWSNGQLTFTLAIARSGPFELSFTTPLPLTGAVAGNLTIRVVPDVHHVHLADARVVEGGARANDTLWQIADRFGDPLTGGYVSVVTSFDGVESTAESPVRSDGAGSSVWVNFTAPSPDAGTVYVLDAFGDQLLAPILVPALSPGGSLAFEIALLAIALVAASAGVVTLARRPPPAPGASGGGAGATDGTGGTSEADLQRFAEGRAFVLARARPDVGRTLDELAEGFPGRPAVPEEVTDWVASLVADGSLRTLLGHDGKSRFLLVEAAVAPDRVSVELDDRALAQALDRQKAESDRADETDRA
jgi:hypothetical protein